MIPFIQNSRQLYRHNNLSESQIYLVGVLIIAIADKLYQMDINVPCYT